MDEAFDQQHVLAGDFQFVAEVDFEHGRFGLVELLVARLDEGADHGHVDGPDEIRHEHETVFQDAERDYGLAAVVVGNLAAEFADSLLNLIGRNDLAQGASRRRSGHGGFKDSTWGRNEDAPGDGVKGWARLRFRPMQIHEYASGYQAKTDEELLRLARDREHLMPEACLALEGELTRRKIRIERETGRFGGESEGPKDTDAFPKLPRGPWSAGQFLTEVLDLYHRHFWFFFKLTVPVVTLSWIIYYAATREVHQMFREFVSRYGLVNPSSKILEMTILRLAEYLLSWMAFSLLFGVICSATREIDSGAVPIVSDSLNAVRARMGRFLRLSLLLFGLVVVATAGVGLAERGLFWAANRFHIRGLSVSIVAYILTGLAFLVVARFGLAMPTVILDGYGIAQSMFLSDELTERKWMVLAALLAKSLIGGYAAGMSPFWLASFVALPLPGWFHWVLSALSIAAVSAVEPVMFIGFALLYIRMSAARSLLGSGVQP